MKPLSLINLEEKLHALPGISKKQAEKIAYYLIQNKLFVGQDLSDAIKSAESKITFCSECFSMCEETICQICQDKSRQKILVIVQSPLDVFKLETIGKLRPHYHVLGDLVNLPKEVDFDDLNIENLKERAKNYKEIIVALSPNLEGIVTANLIKQYLSEFNVTQLALGIPLGAAMEYVDELTLTAAFDNRKEIK